MARWIYNQDPELTPASEQRVAALLSALGEGFTIRWGFFYIDGISREGDFLVQGPDGHILVMEAKAGAAELNALTGTWGTASGENPFLQLDREWSGVMNLLRDHADQTGASLPFVDRVLALPDVVIAPEQTTYQGQPRTRIADAEDLAGFSQWWKARFGGRALHGPRDDAFRLFDEVFAASMPSGATHHTLDFADRVIEQQTRQRFDILDALSDNAQLVFSGGPGTGKTWLAIEQAARWAKAGKRVLFLCYNLELERFLAPVCRKRDNKIEVLSFQSLAAKLLGGAPDTSAMTSQELSDFFEKRLPVTLLEKTSAAGFEPQYDALVVDEAQDHDTSMEGPALAGWWDVYLRLLVEQGAAPVAIFYDRAQRLPLRAGTFDPAVLKNSLLQPVSVRLQRPIRYTRQLRNFIARLDAPATTALLHSFATPVPGLPEGPEPEILPAATEADEGRQCAELIQGWMDRGLVRVQEVAVLFPSSRRPPVWLGTIHGLRFDSSPNPPKDAIRAISVHRAKGLERRAIVLVGFPSWESLKHDDYKATTYVMGVTRAQNLLGIITRQESPDKV